MDEALAAADSMPQFPGGVPAMMKFLATNTQYPTEAREANETGKVFVKFIVDTNGRVTSPIVAKSSGSKSLDAEAVRVISTMPLWKAGYENGKKVKVFFTIPVSFKNLGTINPPPSSHEHDLTMNIWEEGHKLEKEGKYSAALEKYNHSLKAEPTNKYSLFDKGKMLMALGEKEKACEIWNKMILSDIRKDEADLFVKTYCLNESGPSAMVKFLNNNRATFFFSDGMHQVQNNRIEAALKRFDSCLKYNPEHENALFNKAAMHHKLEQKNAACATWKKFLALRPDDKEVEALINKHCK